MGKTRNNIVLVLGVAGCLAVLWGAPYIVEICVPEDEHFTDMWWSFPFLITCVLAFFGSLNLSVAAAFDFN